MATCLLCDPGSLHYITSCSSCNGGPSPPYGLKEFANCNINLAKVESRPSKESLGRYIFLVDLEGHRQDPAISQVLSKVKARTSLFKVFGSYPRYDEGVNAAYPPTPQAPTSESGQTTKRKKPGLRHKPGSA